jgi:hypothetical protein
MLAGAGFRDDPFFPHSQGKEALADGIIDLMSARVTEIFSLEIDLRSAEPAGETLGKIEWSFPAHVIMKVAVKLPAKPRVLSDFPVSLLQFDESRHEGLRDVPAPVDAEMTPGIRPLWLR